MRLFASGAAAGVIALLSPAPARADGAEDIESLLGESVVTTASTVAEKASTAPATSVTITADELRRFGIRTLAEAVSYLSTGVVASDSLYTPDLGARGVLLPKDDGKHFLLLIDGHAVNDPLYGAARFDQGAGVPFDLVDQIEVVLGPGSVLYGSNAMLGVINVITRRASGYRGGHALGEVEVGRTVTAGAGAGVPFRLFGEQAELVAGAEYFARFGPDLDIEEKRYPLNPGIGQEYVFARGGPADGIYGGTIHDAYFVEAPSGLLKVRVGDVELALGGNVYRRGIPYSSQVANVDFDDVDSVEMDRAVRVDLKHHATLSSLVQLTSRAYADSYDYQRWVNRNAQAACFREDIETCQYYDAGLARWAGVEERIAFNWLGDLRLVTLVGVDVRGRWVRAKQDAVDYDTGEPFGPTSGRIDASGALIAPYVQQTWSPSRVLGVNVGARLDADSRFSAIVSPRGAVAVTPVSGTTFRAVYSQAFRAPTWFETDAANYNQAPSSGIEPEIVRSVEGSIEQRFSTQKVLFAVFRTAWDNLIEKSQISAAELARLQSTGVVPITANGVSQYHNVSSMTNYGLDARWDGTLAQGKVAYGASITEAFTRRAAGSSDQRLVVSPRVFGNARLAYRPGGLYPSPAVAAAYVGPRPLDRRDTLAYFAAEPDAPAVVEVRGVLTGAVPAVAGLAYRFGAALATAAEGPYAVGPAGQSVPIEPGAARVPIDRFRAFVGLRYDFAGGDTGFEPEDEQ